MSPDTHSKLLIGANVLADQLQMKMGLHSKDGRHRLEGDEYYSLPVTKKVSFEFKVKVAASFLSTKEAWVLLEVSGNLWAFLAYDVSAKMVYFMLVNGSRESLCPSLLSGLPLGHVLGSLDKDIVARYTKVRGQKEWRRIDGPDHLDEGRTAPAGIDSRENSTQ